MVVLDTSGLTFSSSVQKSNFVSLKMAHFLHCNSCYVRPGMGPQLRYFITNCSHIFCENCVTAATKDSCKVCKSQCSTLCLSGKIPKEVESIFLDPMETLQKFMKEFFKRTEFQRSHQKRLLRHMTEQVKEVNNIIKQAQKLERENHHLKSQNEYLMKIIPKNNNPRNSSKSGVSPHVFQASPSQSPAFGKNISCVTQQYRPCGGMSVSAQTGRLSIRTPPSGGRIGTYNGMSNNNTPGSGGLGVPPPTDSNTPLTIPRPIQFK